MEGKDDDSMEEREGNTLAKTQRPNRGHKKHQSKCILPEHNVQVKLKYCCTVFGFIIHCIIFLNKLRVLLSKAGIFENKKLQNAFNITEDSSLLIIFFVVEVFAAWHLLRWFARPCCIVEGHRLVTGRLVESLVLEADVELAAVGGMRKSVVVAEPQPRVGADELVDDCRLTLGPLRLVGSGASQDERAPNDTGAALARCRVAVDAGGVLVALLRLLRVEVAVLPRAAWGRRWLLQLSPCFALNPAQSYFS